MYTPKSTDANINKEARPLRDEALAKFFNEAELESRPPSVTIGRPVAEVYNFFRDFKNAPLYTKGLQSVSVTNSRVSHWRFVENGETRDCDIEIQAEESEKILSWKIMSTAGTLATQREDYGLATFEPALGGRGTVVSMHISGEKTPGKVWGITQYFAGSEPRTRSEINLRRLKAYLETGEVPTVEGQPHGRDEAMRIHQQ